MLCILWILFSFINTISVDGSVIPYNQPKFCPNSSWFSNADSLNQNNGVNNAFSDLFITINNTIVASNEQTNKVTFWMNGQSHSSYDINAGWYAPYSVFVIGDTLYVGSRSSQNRGVWKWLHPSSNNILQVMQLSCSCTDLFISSNGNIYCAIKLLHQVLMKPLNPELNTYLVVAGTGIAGSKADELDSPLGIFVDTNMDIYVADCHNNRVQLFSNGELNATTVVGNRPIDNLNLSCPTAIILDADRNIFVADQLNHRIVRSGLTGSRCIAGCLRHGSSDEKLDQPLSLAFDNNGNIFVADYGNRRIQIFYLATNMCNQTNLVTTSISTVLASTSASRETVVYSSTSNTTDATQNLFSDISYNRPTLSPNASWNPNATTFASSSTIGTSPYEVFVARDNKVYVPNRGTDYVYVWDGKNSSSYQTIKGNWSDPYTLFVTAHNDLYVSTQSSNAMSRVERRIQNKNSSTSILRGCQYCYDIFVDVKNHLYCSMQDSHQVIRKSLNPGPNAYTIVAGTGDRGAAPYQLDTPMGIFVHTNLTLYVADCGNNRVQAFAFGNSNATTVTASTLLSCPSAVILDADNNLYIANRACSTTSSTAASRLNGPISIAFDSEGNIFVADTSNNRIQVFYLATNSSGQSVTSRSSVTSIQPSSTYRLTSASTASTTSTASTASNTLTVERQSTTDVVQSTRQIGESTSVNGTVQATPPTSPFLVLSCPNQSRIGINCSMSSDPCDMIKPCRNNGTCSANTLNPYGYECRCPAEINGTDCEHDHRPCRPDTCSINGNCEFVPTTNSFECVCHSGWTGIHCESLVNFCSNVTCHNAGVCRPKFLNYTCECVSPSYSGRHCETTSKTLLTRQLVCKSFGYVAIICIVFVASFVLLMDALRFFFGIDPVKKDLERIRRRRDLKRPMKKRRNPHPDVRRFVYVNGPTTTTVQ